MKDVVQILGIPFTTLTKHQILDSIVMGLEKKYGKTFIVTPNPELVTLALDSKEYRTVLKSADLSLPDGIGIVWASKMLDEGIKSRITGVDFMKSLCEKVSKQPVSIGLFGAEPGVAEDAADCLKKMYPGIRILFASSEWDSKNPPVDILFVALGSPKQEKWIYENLDKLQVKVVMGVGGAFDMISGRVKRAPIFMQQIGLEWLWRLFLQPWRLKRQLRLVRFVFLVLQNKYFHPTQLSS